MSYAVVKNVPMERLSYCTGPKKHVPVGTTFDSTFDSICLQ